MATTKKAKKKLPSFKDVVLKRMFWLDRNGPLPGKPPMWSLGGNIKDVAAMDLALSCIDGAPTEKEVAYLADEFPPLDSLHTSLLYLRSYFLIADYVIRHEDEDPSCRWDEDDNDMDSSHPFLIMRCVEAAYRMGYIEGKQAAQAPENANGS